MGRTTNGESKKSATCQNVFGASDRPIINRASKTRVRPTSVLGLGKPEGNFPRVTAHFERGKTKELRDGATSNFLKGGEHLHL